MEGGFILTRLKGDEGGRVRGGGVGYCYGIGVQLQFIVTLPYVLARGKLASKANYTL